MHRIDGPGHVSNQFTEGDPLVPIPATTVTADILNAIQEEIASVIEEGGGALVKTDNTQLLAKIQSLISAATPDASTTVKGRVELLTDAEIAAATDATRAATAANIASLFGASSQTSNGYGRLPVKVGGEFKEFIIQWKQGVNQSASGNQVITYPIAFPNAALRVFPASIYATAAQNGGYAFISATTTQVTVGRDNADNATGVTPIIFAIGY